MKLSHEAREQFKQIMAQLYGVKLSDEQADIAGWHFLVKFKHICEPIPMENNHEAT